MVPTVTVSVEVELLSVRLVAAEAAVMLIEDEAATEPFRLNVAEVSAKAGIRAAQSSIVMTITLNFTPIVVSSLILRECFFLGFAGLPGET
jgi:hypothetical protein